jgi:hydroxyacylglutathione hydrolase
MCAPRPRPPPAAFPAGALLPYDREIVLVTGDGPGARAAASAARELAMIGLDRVVAFAGPEVLDWWREQGRELQVIPSVMPNELAGKKGLTVLDVRREAEWRSGHVPGVANIPLQELQERAAEVPAGRPIVLHCQGGGRSHIAASVLQTLGVDEVVNLSGGFGAWAREGLPVER